jgi:hypothetical protein
MAGPRLPIDAPAFTAAPYGLLSVVDFATESSQHWQNGVTWQSRCMSVGMGGTTYDECIAVTGTGSLPEPSTKLDNVDSINRGATPFTPFVRFDCSPVGLRDADNAARDALAQSESYQVERSFWTGLVDNKVLAFPHLAASADVVDTQNILLQSTASIVVTGAFDVATGLGLLEAALASCYNGVGVVHVPVRALPTLDARGLVRRDGGRDGTTGQLGRRLRTANGNLVAVGAGYPGTSPSGVAPASNQAWIYATGAVFGYRGPVRYTSARDSIDRGANTMQLIAERTYVLGWDCCHVAILINLGVPVT